MTRRVVALLPLLLAQWGCTVTGVSASDGARRGNRCNDSSDCGDSSTSCRDGLCQTIEGVLEAVLIEASPSSDSDLPHLTFVTNVDDVLSRAGAKDIVMPSPVRVTGSLSPAADACYPVFISDDPNHVILPPDQKTNKTLPVTVTLGLRQRLLGLTQQVYYTKTVLTGAGYYKFGVRVPAGEYDVYMVPPKQEGTACVVPPQLYRNYPIGVRENADKPDEAIDFSLSAISRLNLLLTWASADQSLEGWTVDIIEPAGGNRISTEVVLGQPDAAAHTYTIPLVYSAVLGSGNVGADSSGDLVRLRPPASLVAPTIMLDRTALGLLQSDPAAEVRLSAFTRYPVSVEVFGQLVRGDKGTSVPGNVTLVSTEIYGVDPGVFATFQTRVAVESGGLFKVSLPPGKYRIHGEPLLPLTPESDGILSAAETIWDIPANAPTQYGKALELPLVTELSGHAQVVGAQVRAVPSPLVTSPFLAAFGDIPFSPRSSSDVVDERGNFVLPVDPGHFDITLQAPEGLGFGWFVRPGVQVGERNVELGVLSLPWPWRLSGTASITIDGQSQPLASSAIRAYAYLDKNLAYTRDPEQAVSAIEVAETRADDQGRYELLLPAS